MKRVGAALLVLLVGLCSSSALAAIGVGVTTKAAIAGTATVTTSSHTTQASGSTFYIGIGWSETVSVSTVSDSKGNSYTAIGTEQTGFTMKSRVYRCVNCTGGSGHTWTVTMGSASGTHTFFVIEVTGALTVTPDDASSPTAAVDTGTPFVCPTITPSQGNELLIAFGFGNGGAGDNFTAGNSFTEQQEEQNGAAFWTGTMATRVISSIAAYQPSFTASSSSQMHVWQIAIREPAAATNMLLRRRRS